MSSLLDEAIVDAKALREAVLKNAEASLLEAYAPKIEEAVASLLEQEMGMGPAAGGLPGDIGAPPPDIGAPPGGLGMAQEGEETPSTFGENEEESGLGEVEVAALTELDGTANLEGKEEINITRGDLQEMLESITNDIQVLEDEMEDNYTITEDIVELMEQSLEEGKFPDLNKDGETTYADVLIGRGVELDEGDPGVPGGPEEYIVKAGDTLGEIAERYGTSTEYIIGYQLSHKNRIDPDPSKIKVGQKILMPSESLGPVEKYEKMGREFMNSGLDEETVEITEDNIEDIVESLFVDVMPSKSGWAGTPESVMQHNEELAVAKAASGEYKEKYDDLLKVGRELSESLDSHKAFNLELKKAVGALKVKLDEVNLTNAKLFYTNRVLRNTSLNERQKTKIVEVLSNAGSVNETKVLFETLQNAVGTPGKGKPKSLSEAVSRPSSMLPRKRVQNRDSNPFAERMKTLAGIKNN